MINSFVGPRMKLPDLATGGVASAIIIPTAPDTNGNTWMYIGAPSPIDPTDTKKGVWKAKSFTGSPSRIGLQASNDWEWTEAGDLLPSNVQLHILTFRGISPQGPVYDTNDGHITKYSVPAQPYVTIQMQTAPKSNPRNVASFETSITSRDYSFAFPTCTPADPTQSSC